MSKNIVAWLAATASVVYLIVSVLVWKKQGYDVALEALHLTITIGLWSVLGWSIRSYRADAKQSESLRSRILTIEDEHKRQLTTEYERGRKEEQEHVRRQQEYAKQVTAPKPEAELSNTAQFNRYHRIRGAFEALRWSQKIALKRLCLNPLTDFQLLMDLTTSCDFGESITEKIIKPLLESDLVHKHAKDQIEPQPDKLDLIWEFLSQKPLC